MPPLQYKPLHAGARLSDAQRAELVHGLEKTLAADPPIPGAAATARRSGSGHEAAHPPRGVGERVARLGEREAPGEERAPGDRRLAAESLEGDEVVGRRDPAGGDHGQADGQHLGEQVEVRAGERAVARRRRHEEPRDAPASAQRRASSAGLTCGRSRPALDGDPAVPDVDGDDERLAEPLDRSLEEPGESAAVPTITRSAPASSAAADCLERPVAAPDLERQATRRGDTRAARSSDGVPENAPSRSTRWSRVAPSAANRRASSTGSPPSSVTASRRPCESGRLGPRARRWPG